MAIQLCSVHTHMPTVSIRQAELSLKSTGRQLLFDLDPLEKSRSGDEVSFIIDTVQYSWLHVLLQSEASAPAVLLLLLVLHVNVIAIYNIDKTVEFSYSDSTSAPINVQAHPVSMHTGIPLH